MAVKRQVIAGVATLAALYVGVSNALGLGEMRLDSSLNQPLSATIQLQDTQGLSASDIIVSLAEPDAFDRAGIDRPFFLTDLRFIPVVENDRLIIRVESTRPVREPYLNFLVELRRPGGRMLREYTVLLDPPLYDPRNVSVAVPSPPQAQPRVTSTPAAARPQRGATEPARTTSQRAAAEPARTTLQQLPDMQPQQDAQQYTTQAGDSLWEIAISQRPDRSVPIRASMSAIYALNPDAFIGGDIDKLRQGHILTLPTNEQLVDAGAPEELLSVTRDGVTGERSVEEPASPAGTDEQAAVSARPEEDAAERVEAESVDADRAVDPVSAPADIAAGEAQADAAPLTDADPTADPESAEVRLRIEETTLEAVDADSSELLGRLNALESRFNVLLSELDARDAQIASLQAELEVLREAKAAEAALDGDLAGTAGSGTLGEGDTGAGPSAAGGSDDPAAGAVAANVLPGEEAATSSTSWLSWLTLPLVFIAFLLGWLLSRRRHQEDEAVELDDQDQRDAPGGFSSNITTIPAMVARPVAQPAARPPVDPLDGVELYVTYGRFAEARTMLDKAIDEEPERLDLRYKQLRVLAELGDGSAFAEQEEDVIELGGDLERVDQIKGRFPLLFNARGDIVDQVDEIEPPLGGDDQDDAQFSSGIEEEHDESNTSQLNLNDFTLDPDWDLIDGLSPEPMRKTGAGATASDSGKTISDEEFESSLHKLPQVEELEGDEDRHFTSTELYGDDSPEKK